MPIVEIDGQKIVGDGKPGEVTKRLGERFEQQIEAYVRMPISLPPCPERIGSY